MYSHGPWVFGAIYSTVSLASLTMLAFVGRRAIKWIILALVLTIMTDRVTYWVARGESGLWVVADAYSLCAMLPSPVAMAQPNRSLS